MLLLIICLPLNGSAQLSAGVTFDQYNLNITNGLPVNHVYYMIRDHHGYLWLATTNGVVRYNGYECKIFNLSNGLPTADVWSLYEDARGRIWLGNISKELGYIYRNEYHRAIKGDLHFFYPLGFAPYGDGITCIGNGFSHVYATYGDTVKELNRSREPEAMCIMSPGGTPYFVAGDSVYVGAIEGDSVKMKGSCRMDSSLVYRESTAVGKFIFGDYLVAYASKEPYFVVTNTNTGKLDTILTGKYLAKPEQVFIIMDGSASRNDKNIQRVVTSGHILQFSADGYKYVGAYPISNFVSDSNINGGNVTSFLYDELWGYCLGTNNNGLYISYARDSPFVRFDPGLTNYRLVGQLPDRTTYWWNSSTSTLAHLADNRHLTRYKLDITDISYILAYGSDSLIIFGTRSGSSYWFFPGTGHLVAQPSVLGTDVVAAAAMQPGQVLVASKRYLYEVNCDSSQITRYNYDYDRFRGMTYDSLRKAFWAYNYDKLYLHFYRKKDTIILSDHIGSSGVGRIEKVIIDNKYGNVFIKSNDKLLSFNYETGQCVELLTNYNFAGTRVDVCGNTLVAAGEFGILFCRIEGPQRIAAPLVYRNVKSQQYHSVSEMVLAAHEAILATDNGMIAVRIPGDSILLKVTGDKESAGYKFIVNYNNATIDIAGGDTLRMNQEDPVVELDFINPYGEGRLRYTYRIIPSKDTMWHELNGSVLNLNAVMKAGEYSRLEVIAYDNVVRSNRIQIYLYPVPYWWQTVSGRSALICFIVLLISLSVLVTRRLVLRNARKRHLRMEMELKSIYAQINPHFIFNTLSSALLMVSKNKMDDAYTHISKFSKLLRAYLRSSRDRYITIADETDNLRNYIELQQVRFKDKFAYNIFVHELIDGQRVKIPSLLVQPFVENAINHGLLHKDGPGKLEVGFNTGSLPGSIVCTIADDGIGRELARSMAGGADKYGSYGDALIKDLVRIFNTYETMNIEIKYTDLSTPNTGTRVDILINNAPHGKQV